MTTHCYSVLYIRERGELFAGFANGHIVGWRKAQVVAATSPGITLTGHKGTIRCLHYAPQLKVLFSASADRHVKGIPFEKHLLINSLGYF